jgi:hypothetical protein
MRKNQAAVQTYIQTDRQTDRQNVSNHRFMLRANASEKLSEATISAIEATLTTLSYKTLDVVR